MKQCINCQTELADDALFCLQCGQSQVTDDDDALLGQVVADRYLIKRRVGSGSAGTVYEARHVTLQQRMAVKFLHHHLCQDDVAVERFRREATTVAQLDNPHLIEVRDFGVADDGRLYLAMEYLEGRTLADLLSEASPLSLPQTLDLLSQVVDGLTEAHSRGYIHRDLRPANLFLMTRGGREEFVKIMDFGLSKLMLHELEPGQATVGMSFGDPTYLSPEQAAGEAADHRSDVYALGVMAYEMLTGSPPFRGDDVFATVNMHLRVKPEAPSRRHHGLSFAFDAPILKALSKKREERWDSAAAFRDALGQAAASTTHPGLGTSLSGGKRRRDETIPSIPSAIRESAEMPSVQDDPNTTRLGLGTEPMPPELVAAAREAAPKITAAPAPTPEPTSTPAPAPTSAPAPTPAPAPAAAPVSTPTPAPAAPLADATVEEPEVLPAPAPVVAPSDKEPAPAPVVGGAAAASTPLPERPDGSGPHPIPPGAEGGASVGAPAQPDEEVPDPTMSQMWYAEGEAEAAEAMAEYEDFRREQKKQATARPRLKGAGASNVAIPSPMPTPPPSASMSTTSITLPRSRARTVLLATVGVVVVVIIVVSVLLSRSSRRPDGDETGESTTAGMADMDAAAGEPPRRVAPDGGAAPEPSDGGAVTVVDMAVQIDGPGPSSRRPDPRRRPWRSMGPRRPGMRRVMGPDRPPPMKSEAAGAVALGRRALSGGDTTTARLEFQRALAIRRGYGPALAGLGEVYFELGQYGSAVAKLRAATRAMPSSVRTWVLLGNACYRSGRLASAKKAFETALRLRPGHREAKRNLALVTKRLGGM